MFIHIQQPISKVWIRIFSTFFTLWTKFWFVCLLLDFLRQNQSDWLKKKVFHSGHKILQILLLEIVETCNFDQLTWMKGSGVCSNHMSSDFFPTFGATFTFSHIMFFTEIFAIKCVNCTNDGLFTFGTFVRSPLKK